jgi:branched-subunit amino acid aminotransferase/4-amino-4-deoxychorismate lyase
MAGIKTTSYAENVKALAYAKERGCAEAIFATTTGLLCEGTGSNVFVAIDGRLVTPPLSSGCLAGVTRELVLEVTDAVEEDIPGWRRSARPTEVLPQPALGPTMGGGVRPSPSVPDRRP